MQALTIYVETEGYQDVVAGYVIWNEPNIQEQWFPGVAPNPAAYMTMLKSAYKGAKAGDPAAVIVSAPLAPTSDTPNIAINDLDYLAQLYDLGLADYADYIGMNGLGFQYDPDHDTGTAAFNFTRLKYMHDIMLSKGDTQHKVWALEVGWLRDSSYNMGAFEPFKVSAEQQAQFLLHAFEKARYEWHDWLDLMTIWNLDFNHYYPPTSNFHWYAIDGTLAESYFSNECWPTIQSIGNGKWNEASTWNQNRVPNDNDVVLIRSGYTVIGPELAQVKVLCNQGVLQSQAHKNMKLTASGIISNAGQILGSNGIARDAACGRPGSNIRLRGNPFQNSGTIQAGSGGDGQQCGGQGGYILIQGQDSTNHGTICAGHGGHVTGTNAGQAGNGGQALIWGKFFQYGGYLQNHGLTCGGNGGNGNPAATAPQQGGQGGTLKLISWPYVYLAGGQHYAGQGGQGSGGASNGRGGQVIIEPNLISLAGQGTEIRGEDVIIFGGDDFVLDLSNMDNASIVATQAIILAVGSGHIDLRGNTSPILQAGNQVVIKADTILADVEVATLVNAPQGVTTGGNQTLYDSTFIGPGWVSSKPGRTLPITLTLLNNTSAQQAYTLTVASHQNDWTVQDFPTNITLDGFDYRDLVLKLNIPDAITKANTITMTANSQNDKSIIVTEVELLEADKNLFLPIILKQR